MRSEYLNISSLTVVAASERHPQLVSVMMTSGWPCYSEPAPIPLIPALIIKSTNGLFAEASPTGTGNAAIAVATV